MERGRAPSGISDTPLAHSPTLPQPLPGESVPGGRLPPGTPVGEYVLDQFLGAGAMGEVYAGHHPVIGKKVAIKILRHELATSEEAAERFTREARAVNQVDHPNVIDTFAYGRLGDGRLYLVMALVAGESLRERLREGALDVVEVLPILGQIADALDAAHERGVVHRDLKPDNIMITTQKTETRVLVLDFGIAKLISGEARPGNGTLTGQGTWLGTPAYMAPEQWSADGAGPASDRYALGVIAFELLSGRLPFAAASVPGMMEQHFRAKVPALSMRGSTSSALDDVLARALAKDPDARYPSAQAFMAALRAAVGTAAGAAVEATPAVAPGRWLYGAIGAGTLGLGIVGAVLIHRDHRSEPAADAPPEAVAGSIAVEVTSTPDRAEVVIGERVVGTTPYTLHVANNARVELTVKKPGYLPSHRSFAVGSADSQLAINLGAVSRFEGVWKLPTGELRAFERDGERVAISKLTEVDGHRTLFKSYPFVDAEPGSLIAFATDDEVIDPRAPDEKSCHIGVHVEYRYDAATDDLVLRRPTVAVDFVAGHCVARHQELAPQRLVRVDAAHDSVEITAPAGDLSKSKPRAPSKKAAIPRPTLSSKSAQKSIVPIAPANTAENKLDLPEKQAPRQAPENSAKSLSGDVPQAQSTP
jgi:tRNA A-37 threonylcarbamoyl transferase component Bud32